MMVRVPFATLVFRGARFDGGAMPVEALAELAVYRDLVVAMAQAQFRQRYPTRLRLPKGFAAKLHLVLAKQEPGSTVPLLERVVPYTGTLPGFASQDEFDDALGALRTTFDEAVRGVPFTLVEPSFANRLLSFGRTLRDDESVTLGTATGREGPVIDRYTRRRLGELAGGPLEEDVELVGLVRAADRDRDSFGLRTADGERVEILSPGPLLSRVLASLADDTVVKVRGVGSFDPSGERVGRVRAVDINLAEEGEDGCATAIPDQLADLGRLQAGWLDGEGGVYDSDGLRRVGALLQALVAQGMPVPYLYPRPDGRVQAEWSGRGIEVSAQFALDLPEVDILATRLDSGISHDELVSLAEPGGELRLARRLTELLRGILR